MTELNIKILLILFQNVTKGARTKYYLILFQNVTKGARTKIVVSLNKLKERQNLLRSLEKVIFHFDQYISQF